MDKCQMDVELNVEAGTDRKEFVEKSPLQRNARVRINRKDTGGTNSREHDILFSGRHQEFLNFLGPHIPVSVLRVQRAMTPVVHHVQGYMDGIEHTQ